MRMFLSLAQAKARLKLDSGTADDADLQLVIQAATSALLNYLKSPTLYQDSHGDVLVDSHGDVVPQTRKDGPGVPPEVMLSTALLVGLWMRDRDGFEINNWQQGYLPWFVTAPIYMLRDPTIG
jgi:hypothetical protein